MEGVKIERLAAYSDHIAEGIGALGPDLSKKFTGVPMAQEHLEEIIASPYHDQLLASVQGRIVGVATMSLILGGVSEGRKAWLEDFVVSSDDSILGKGIGFNLWHEVIAWSREKRAGILEFTSNASRKDAHKFYHRQGASIQDTTVFKVTIY